MKGTELTIAHVELWIPCLTEAENSVGTKTMGGGIGMVEVTVRGSAVEDMHMLWKRCQI